MMASFETHDEYRAFLSALSRIDDGATLQERERAVWLAGRDWHRQQSEREIQEATARLMARRGMRLMGCSHYPSCGSVDECRRVVSG
jgi:hypothetical protein